MAWHKVCHQWTLGKFTFKFCSKEPTYPGWYIGLHTNDPDPAPLEIGGMDASLLRDGDGLAAIAAIAATLNSELATPISSAVQSGVTRLQKRLPESVRFQLMSE